VGDNTVRYSRVNFVKKENLTISVARLTVLCQPSFSEFALLWFTSVAEVAETSGKPLSEANRIRGNFFPNIGNNYLKLIGIVWVSIWMSLVYLQT